MKVCIDPGHGGADSGAVGNGMYEKTINLDVAEAVKQFLEAHGVEVIMTRESDVFVDLGPRCDIANASGADLFVSIHHNAGAGIGYELYHSINGGAGVALCNYLAAQFRAIGQVPHGAGILSKQGQNGDYYAVIRQTQMTSIISEFGYIDNSTDAQKFNTHEQRVAEGRAIAIGILNFAGISLDEQPADQTSEQPTQTSGANPAAPVVEDWKQDIMTQAQTLGLITAEHNPDDVATKWFVLAVVENLYKKINGGK